MQLIDTHTHIYQDEFKEDIVEVINNARRIGISKLLLPNVDTLSIDAMHQLCDDYPEICYPMMGLHPTSVSASCQDELQKIRTCFESRKYIAVGEIGIDLYWDKTFIKEQKNAFEEQLKWSMELNLPVVIHNRDAFSEVIASIERVGADKLRGVFHSFGGSKEEMERIFSLKNFLLGINGVITFKNSKLGAHLPIAPLSKIVLETDAPYLTPVPHRGKRNEPAYLALVVEKLSGLYEVPARQIADITTRNAMEMFFYH